MKRLLVLVSLGLMLAIPSVVFAEIDLADVTNTPGLIWSVNSSLFPNGYEGVPFGQNIGPNGVNYAEYYWTGVVDTPNVLVATIEFPTTMKIDTVGAWVRLISGLGIYMPRTMEVAVVIGGVFVNVASGDISYDTLTLLDFNPVITTRVRVRFTNPSDPYNVWAYVDDIVVYGKVVTPPGADAGSNQVSIASVLLDGTGSNDTDGMIVSYKWVRNLTGEVIGTSATALVPVYYGMSETFTLTVTDDDGLTDTDVVLVSDSLSGMIGDLASKGYVDSAIAAIPAVDLTGYATESYVNGAIAAIPPVDLTGYATESYVNGAIAALKDEIDTRIKDYMNTHTHDKGSGGRNTSGPTPLIPLLP